VKLVEQFTDSENTRQKPSLAAAYTPSASAFAFAAASFSLFGCA
jgi:hypothetical protein